MKYLVVLLSALLLFTIPSHISHGQQVEEIDIAGEKVTIGETSNFRWNRAIKQGTTAELERWKGEASLKISYMNAISKRGDQR